MTRLPTHMPSRTVNSAAFPAAQVAADGHQRGNGVTRIGSVAPRWVECRSRAGSGSANARVARGRVGFDDRCSERSMRSSASGVAVPDRSDSSLHLSAAPVRTAPGGRLMPVRNGLKFRGSFFSSSPHSQPASFRPPEKVPTPWRQLIAHSLRLEGPARGRLGPSRKVSLCSSPPGATPFTIHPGSSSE
jgi:hypothetical protein